MRFARIVFRAAGIYGMLMIPPHYFLEERIGRDYPPAITHPEFFYGFVGVALAWQVAFLILAQDPARYRMMMLPAILEKVTFGLAAIVLYAAGRISAATHFFGWLDLVLGALFVAAFMKTSPGTPSMEAVR